MVTFQALNEESYEVFVDGESVGRIHTHGNPFHGRNCYLKLELDRMDFDPEGLFAGIYAEKGRPLHMMMPHPQRETAEFALAGGFGLRRRCFLMKVKKEDLLVPIAGGELLEYKKGTPEYNEACVLLYDQYARDHAPISPLTADHGTFNAALPGQILCRKTDGKITQYVFPDGAEIAYMGSEELSGFRAFAEAVLEKLFAEYETLEFESDNIDEVAMTMRALFTEDDGFSLDTYTYDPEFGKA